MVSKVLMNGAEISVIELTKIPRILKHVNRPSLSEHFKAKPLRPNWPL